MQPIKPTTEEQKLVRHVLRMANHALQERLAIQERSMVRYTLSWCPYCQRVTEHLHSRCCSCKRGGE